MEIKHAAKSFTVTAKDMDALRRRAARQEKEPLLILRFNDGTEVVMHVGRYT